MQETWVDPQIGKIPWRREWQPTLGFLPGEFHGQRSLAGYSPRDHKESETTEQRWRQWLLLSPTLVTLLVDLGRFPTQARIGLVIRKSQWLEFQSCPLTSGQIYELLVWKVAYHSSTPALRILPDLALCTSSSGCSSVFFIISFTINWET